MIKNAYLVIVPIALIGLCFHFSTKSNSCKDELYECQQNLEFVSKLVVEMNLNELRRDRNTFWESDEFVLALRWQKKIDLIDSLRREGYTNYWLINHPSFLVIGDTAQYKLPNIRTQGKNSPVIINDSGDVNIRY